MPNDTPITIRVPDAVITALRYIAPKENSKYAPWLQSLYFEIGEDEGRAVALTDVVGGVFRLEFAAHHDPKRGIFRAIVPRTAFDGVRSRPCGFNYELTFTPMGNTCKVDIVYGGQHFVAHTIDSNYANFRAVFPRDMKHPGEAMAYDPEQLMVFKKIGKLLNPKGTPLPYRLHMNGRSTTLVFIVDNDGPDFVGVVMPCRDGLCEHVTPEWLFDDELSYPKKEKCDEPV